MRRPAAVQLQYNYSHDNWRRCAKGVATNILCVSVQFPE